MHWEGLGGVQGTGLKEESEYPHQVHGNQKLPGLPRASGSCSPGRYCHRMVPSVSGVLVPVCRSWAGESGPPSFGQVDQGPVASDGSTSPRDPLSWRRGLVRVSSWRLGEGKGCSVSGREVELMWRWDDGVGARALSLSPLPGSGHTPLWGAAAKGQGGAGGGAGSGLCFRGVGSKGFAEFCTGQRPHRR